MSLLPDLDDRVSTSEGIAAPRNGRINNVSPPKGQWLQYHRYLINIDINFSDPKSAHISWRTKPDLRQTCLMHVRQMPRTPRRPARLPSTRQMHLAGEYKPPTSSRVTNQTYFRVHNMLFTLPGKKCEAHVQNAQVPVSQFVPVWLRRLNVSRQPGTQ